MLRKPACQASLMLPEALLLGRTEFVGARATDAANRIAFLSVEAYFDEIQGEKRSA
ncbi:MAG: hypothetical protein ACFCAD_12745 [Pleurocapsa sp.]